MMQSSEELPDAFQQHFTFEAILIIFQMHSEGLVAFQECAECGGAESNRQREVRLLWLCVPRSGGIPKRHVCTL